VQAPRPQVLLLPEVLEANRHVTVTVANPRHRLIKILHCLSVPTHNHSTTTSTNKIIRTPQERAAHTCNEVYIIFPTHGHNGSSTRVVRVFFFFFSILELVATVQFYANVRLM
jgi:hypothetical protein